MTRHASAVLLQKNLTRFATRASNRDFAKSNQWMKRKIGGGGSLHILAFSCKKIDRDDFFCHRAKKIALTVISGLQRLQSLINWNQQNFLLESGQKYNLLLLDIWPHADTGGAEAEWSKALLQSEEKINIKPKKVRPQPVHLYNTFNMALLKPIIASLFVLSTSS